MLHFEEMKGSNNTEHALSSSALQPLTGEYGDVQSQGLGQVVLRGSYDEQEGQSHHTALSENIIKTHTHTPLCLSVR